MIELLGFFVGVPLIIALSIRGGKMLYRILSANCSKLEESCGYTKNRKSKEQQVYEIR